MIALVTTPPRAYPDDSSPCSATTTLGSVVTKAIISRKEAKEQGSTRYNGKTCKKHPELNGLKYTCSAKCVGCVRKRGKEHIAKKRRDNPILKAKESAISSLRVSERLKNDPVFRAKHYVRVQNRKNRLRKNDPIFNLKCCIRRRMCEIIRGLGFTKKSGTGKIIGCTWQQLKEHIESQFTEDMGWENRNLWHIDHIVPLITAKTEEDVYRLNHFTNLQPLWIKDNLSKGSKLINI